MSIDECPPHMEQTAMQNERIVATLIPFSTGLSNECRVASLISSTLKQVITHPILSVFVRI